MALIISPSPGTTLPSSWPSESNTPLRDASFSSYLTASEETYIRALPHSAHHLRKKPEDGHEIDIFGAEKYFNQSIHPPKGNTVANFKQYNTKDQTKVDVKVQQPRTPSCHSESSWNSQSSLLKRVQRLPSRGTISTASNNNNNNNNKAQGRKLFLLPCYCCDKKSIVVDQQQADIKNNVNKIITLHTDPDFVFPVPEAVSKALTTFDNADALKEEGRKSLEVFGSSSELPNNIEDNIGSKSFSLEKRLNMLSWDSIHKPIEELDTLSVAAPSESYRDSDVSSDLFELDCLSCNANPIGSTGHTPPRCYAPSEASIEWSVVTASAADFSEDQRSTTRARPVKKVPQKSKPRATALLLGCKSQKAVGVVGEVHKTLPANRKAVVVNNINNEEKKKTVIKSKYSEEYVSISMSRFKAESTKLEGKNKVRQERSPRWSHSSYASDLLYIH